MYHWGVSMKQVKISVEGWEALYKLAKKHKRPMGNMIEILVAEAGK